MYFDIVKLDPVNNYYLFTKEDLINLKQSISKTHLREYEQDMSGLFDAPLESVVTKKTLPPSHNPHDYVSLATYFWPNPNTIEGIPYIQKDGLANPDGANYDKDKFRRLAYLVYHSGLLYYLTDNQNYYRLLKKHCMNWFINEKTKMNPNLKFGQFIPGVVDGRAEGIIDYSANFSYALHMMTLLSRFNLIDKELFDGLTIWHTCFRNWLQESEIGKAEQNAKNNHGTFYDLALLIIEIFLGNHDQIINLSSRFLNERITKQIMEDGSLPYEITRTKSKSYTFMGLKGLLDFAELVNGYGVNLMDSKIKSSVEWLYNLSILSKDPWPYIQMTQFDEGIYLQFINQITKLYGDKYNNRSTIDIKKIVNKVPYYLFIK